MTYAAPGNVTSTVGMFEYINEIIMIDGTAWFFPGVILAVWFIILIKMKFSDNDTGKSFAAASFMCMIIAVFARVLNFVSTGFMSFFIIATALGGLWMHIENK